MTTTSLATVRTMAHVRLVGHRRRSYAERLRLLGVLVRDAQWLEPAILEDSLVTYAHDSLTRPQLDEWWAEALARKAIADAAEIGIVDSDWRCGSCAHRFAEGCGCTCCPSLIDHAHACVTEALEVLAGGIR
jgi:hypothetical protein